MGILDQFDSDAGAADADQYEGFLAAANVAPAGQTAVIRGFGSAKMEDGKVKPYVVLQATFRDGTIVRESRRALILKRSNGNRLAAAAKGDEASLIGKGVDLKLGTTEFRGRAVATVDLFVRLGGSQ